MSTTCRCILPAHRDLSGLFGAMSDGMVAVDEDLLVLYGNASAARMLGCDVEDLSGGSGSLSSIVKDEELCTAITRLIRDEPGAESVAREWTIERPQRANLTVHISPVLTPKGALLLLPDEGGRKAERSRQLRLASHEMKAPIGAVLSYLHILRDEIDKAHPSFRYKEILVRSIARLDALLELVNDMRNLDYVELHGGLEEMSTVDLTEVLRECIESASDRAQEKEIAIETRLTPLPSVEADRAGLVRVFDELLQNAIRYTRDGGTISVESGTEEHRVWVRVADTGIGIPAAEMGRIFDRFYRERSARTREITGTGLGLCVVKRILQSHSGDIRVESEEDRGSAFTVTL